MRSALSTVVLAPLPKVPSTSVIYKTTLTTTTDETTTTWTAVDIGVPHPKRLVILAFYTGNFSGGIVFQAPITVNGIPPCAGYGGVPTGIGACQVPNGTDATITLTRASSVRKAVSVYVAYPQSFEPIDFNTFGNTGQTSATLSDIKLISGGFAIYAACANAQLVTFSTTWNGTDTLVEDVDAQLESASSYTMGHINAGVSSDLGDAVETPSATSDLSFTIMSWGPPPPGN